MRSKRMAACKIHLNSVLILPIVFSIILFSCAKTPDKEPEKNTVTVLNDHPTNYSAFVLSGSTLLATSASVNGLSVDTASADSISNSVAAILASSSSGIVAEVDSKDVNYTIDFTAAGKPVPPLFYGADIQIASKVFLAMPQYIELIRNIKVDIIRFPGGQERTSYIRDPGAATNLNLGTYQTYQNYITGNDVSNYIELCRELNAFAEPQINLYNNDPAMWSNMADQIVNELGYDLKYLSAGNEPEYNSCSNWSFLQALNPSEAVSNYTLRYLVYSRMIRAVKPDVNFAFGEFGGDANNNFQLGLSMLGTNNPGALSLHWYMLGDFRKSGDCTISTISLCSRSTIGFGRPAGPSMPFQPRAS